MSRRVSYKYFLKNLLTYPENDCRNRWIFFNFFIIDNLYENVLLLSRVPSKTIGSSKIWEEDQRGMNETDSECLKAWKSWLHNKWCKKNIQRNLPTWLKVIFKIELRYDRTCTFLFYFCQWEEILSKVSLKI